MRALGEKIYFGKIRILTKKSFLIFQAVMLATLFACPGKPTSQPAPLSHAPKINPTSYLWVFVNIFSTVSDQSNGLHAGVWK